MKAFLEYIPNGRIGVVLKRTESLVWCCGTTGCTSGNSSLLDSFSSPFSGSMIWGVFTSANLGSLLFAFFSCTLPSPEVLLFFSCQYCFPPLLCSFLPDIILWILLFRTSYLLAISACDLLLAMQSPMARSNSVAWSPMVFHTLFIFSSSIVL